MRERIHSIDLKLDSILRQMASDRAEAVCPVPLPMNSVEELITLNNRLETYEGMHKLIIRHFNCNHS